MLRKQDLYTIIEREQTLGAVNRGDVVIVEGRNSVVIGVEPVKNRALVRFDDGSTESVVIEDWND